MSFILHISTAVPEFRIEKEDMARFYSEAFASDEKSRFIKKLNFLNKKTKIDPVTVVFQTIMEMLTNYILMGILSSRLKKECRYTEIKLYLLL